MDYILIVVVVITGCYFVWGGLRLIYKGDLIVRLWIRMSPAICVFCLDCYWLGKHGAFNYPVLLTAFAIGVSCWLVELFYLAAWLGKPLKQIGVDLARGSDLATSASSEISSASQSLAEGASEQAASIEETSSSLEEISSMTKQNADHAEEANTLMKQTNQVVGTANDSMIALTQSMEEISNASDETSKIIKTIDEVAFQTNLLALNAAVEAARAGEAGAGFAVVADEVRNLAMRAADAAQNTADLIEGTVRKVHGGSELVVKTNDAFTQVLGSTGKVGQLVNEIAVASGEQAHGIEQVNKAVTRMDKVVQEVAANAEESASASAEMNAQAGQMKDMVDTLTRIVGNGGTRSDRGDSQAALLSDSRNIKRHFSEPQPTPKSRKKAAVSYREVLPEQVTL